MIKNTFIDKSIAQNNLSRPGLQPYLRESFSQSYEDIISESILLSICKRHNISMDSMMYIDIGANHSISTSNTYLFYKKYNMYGILLEANPLLCAELRSFRKKDITINAVVVNNNNQTSKFYISNRHEISSLSKDFIDAWGKLSNGLAHIESEIELPNIRINDIFKIARNRVGILSIDIEGMDKDIILDLDIIYRPIIIIIEPSDFFITSNSSEIISIMENRNYNLSAITDVNLVFIDKNML